VASKFARFKSGSLQREEHTAREHVQSTNQSLTLTASNTASKKTAKLDAAVIAAAVCQRRHRLSACAGDNFEHCWQCVFAITAAFEAFNDSSNPTVTGRCSSDFLAADSYEVGRFNTRRLFNSHGKVVTPFRCSSHLLR